MCDEKLLQRWAKDQVNRRDFAIVAGAATLAACTPSATASNEGSVTGANASAAPQGRPVSFDTKDGVMDALFFAGGDGARPAVIHWPDIAGIRASHLAMAQRTALQGYSVIIVNPYYRDQAGVIWEDFASFADGGWDKARAMIANFSSSGIQDDASAIVAWLDQQPEVDTARGIGAEGYCMGGPFTVYSAHAEPGRVKAAASFHGGGLVRSDDASPHKLLPRTDAQFLIAVARDDDAKAPTHKSIFSDAARSAGRKATVEVYQGDHGWTVPDSPAYSKQAAEKAFADKIALYKSAL